MKSLGINGMGRLYALGLLSLFAASTSNPAHAQAPYPIPYTINTILGGGTAPTVGASCAGPNGTTVTAEDTLGDGCLASAAVAGTDLHDVGVDPFGNIIFIDNESSAVIRRIDARSGVVNVLAGSVAASKLCAGTTDAYGDGCPANDGKGNAAGGYTAAIPKERGLSVAKNGDVYLADYSQSLVHKISASTGLMTLFAGTVAGGTVTNPSGNKGLGTTGGYGLDGGQAVGSDLHAPRGVTVDSVGNVYIADTGNNVVRMVNTAGIISTFVGKNPNTTSSTNTIAPAGATGDGGPANQALLSAPEDVELDANGNLYIGDFGNNKVRVVYQSGAVLANLIALTNSGAVAQPGYIYTIVGGGTGVYTAGTQVLATSVAIGNPRKLSVDPRGNVYIADNTNDIVWFVDATTGFMRTLAGQYGKTSGSTCTTIDALGDGCAATLATLNPNSEMGIGLGPQGDVYISDSADARIRKVALDNTFPAVAHAASVSQTIDIHFAANDTPAAGTGFTIVGNQDFLVPPSPSCPPNTDNTTDCNVVVNFTPSLAGPEYATLAVKSTAGLTTNVGLNGIGTSSAVALDPGNAAALGGTFNAPAGIAQDGAGNTYIADTGNNRIVEVTSGGASSVVAGTGTSGYAGDGAAAASAKLAAPQAIAVTPDGAVYIADTGNNVIRRVDPITHVISTFGGGAGTLCTPPPGDTVDAYGDGCPATSAKFSVPAGLVSDNLGNLYVSDTGNSVIREIGTTGYVNLIAGGASTVCGADVLGNGCAATQTIFKSPTAIQIDSSRNLYIADTGDNEVRKLTSGTGIVSIVAGTGQAGGAGNGGLATTAQVNGPTGLALDAAGNVYISDTGNSVIRLVSAAGTINTVAGTLGSSGTSTLPSSASTLLLTNPSGIVASGIGTLFVLDTSNNRALTVTRGSASYNFGRTNLGSSSPTTTIQETSTGSASAVVEASGSQLFTASGSTTLFSLVGSTTNGCTNSSTSGLTLAPGASCSLTAQFTPAAIGASTATYTESSATTINSPAPAITLTGTGAVLTKTTLTTAVTTPATGNPQYSISFVVTATLHPAQCDPTAPNCSAAGTVTFLVDGTQVGLPVAVSNTSTTSSNVITASQTIGGQSVGTHTVVAVYSGDTYYASSTAPSLAVTVAQGATTTTVAANPATLNQFSTLTLTAQVKSATSTIPTGTVAFYYGGTTLIGTAGVNPTTGIATLNDTNPATTLGLFAGTYSITGVYSGDSNYAGSTSAAASLVVNPDPQGFAISLSSAAVGTAQGSTAQTLVYVTPTNTLSGTLTFSCSGLPTNSVCTFSATPSATEQGGTTLVFSPVPGAAVQQSASVTLWTDVSPGVIPTSSEVRPYTLDHTPGTSLASVLGWPFLLAGLAGIVAARKRLRHTRLLTIVALCALLAGSATVFTGCLKPPAPAAITPTGTYTVTLTVSGPGSLVKTIPITFTVATGVAGQL